MPPSRKKGSRAGKGTHPAAKRKPPKRGKSKKTRRSAAAKKGWDTRRKRAKAEKAARTFVTRTEAQPWSHDEPGWVPSGGWQGDQFAEEIAYMTHEEKIEWLEWLAEQLDTTISELFEMMGSP